MLRLPARGRESLVSGEAIVRWAIRIGSELGCVPQIVNPSLDGA